MEIPKISNYEATGLLSELLIQMEIVPENQRILALDASLKGTPTRWWTTHKDGIDSRSVATHLLQQ